MCLIAATCWRVGVSYKIFRESNLIRETPISKSEDWQIMTRWILCKEINAYFCMGEKMKVMDLRFINLFQGIKFDL